MAQSFLNCSGGLIAEMNATRSVDNDSRVGHKKRASHSDCSDVRVHVASAKIAASPRFALLIGRDFDLRSGVQNGLS